jgi:serine/threonine-protein kinase
MGTAPYMAPEQARQAADAGPLADVYSIGAILYHMLSGQPPYGSLPAVSRFALLLQEEPARPRTIEPSIPDGVEAVIQHAMARDTSLRVPSALELERQLAVFDEPVAAPERVVAIDMPEHTARTFALRARLARPAALFTSIASSLAAAAWLIALLATLLEPTRRGERTLLGIIGGATVISLVTVHARALRASWQSSPAVSRYIAPFSRALLAGVTAFGALELVRVGWFAVAHISPYGLITRLVGAGVAAVLGLGWRRWRLHTRLGRLIG